MNWKEPFFAGKIYWCWHKRCHSILTTSNLQCWLVHCVNQMRGCIDWSLSSPYHRCRLWISENWLLAPVPSSGNYWCHVGPCYPLYYGGHNVSPCLPPPPPGMRAARRGPGSCQAATASATLASSRGSLYTQCLPILSPASAPATQTPPLIQWRYCEPVAFILYLFFVVQ